MRFSAVFILCAAIRALASSDTAEISAERCANIPQARQPIVLDGALSQEEWADAAVLCRFESVPQEDSHAKPSQPWNGPETSVRMKHDGTNLWIGIHCAESEAGYPQAYRRPPNGNLDQDDAVQIVLATPTSRLAPRGVLNMGGYEGALDTPTVAASDYYSFTVNAVGVAVRAWNEMPLRTPLFDSAAARDAAGWSVEYRIPLASFGARQTDVEARFFFNAFRFRPPLLIGWHLPGFGGYIPMPFGQIRLLSEARFNERTQEVARKRPAAEPLGFSASIGYYPLSGSVVGVIDGLTSLSVDRAVLRVTGLPEQSLDLSSSNPDGKRRLLIAPLIPGTQPARSAELTLYAGTNAVRTTRRDLSAVTAPEWLGTDAGAAYIRDKIPFPWTRPIVDGRSITLCDKTLRVGAFGLFDSVVGPDGESLAGPAEIELAVGQRRLALRPRTPVVTPDGNAVRIEARADAGTAAVETRTRIDYDGFTEVKLRLSGLQPQELSRFRVRIPLRKDIAKFAHRELTQRIVALDGFGFDGRAGPLWVGDETRGLAFSSDTPLFFSDNKRHHIRVIEERRCTWLELTFVDGPGQAPSPLPVFRFILQPTPTKPRPAQCCKPAVTDYHFELWSDYQGYPDLAKIPELRTWASTASAVKQIPILYTCQGLAENAPGFAEFREDLMKQTPWMFYRRHSDPGQGVACYACCKRGPEGDLQLWSFARLAREAGIRGVLSDGLGAAWSDDNPGHAEGCGREIPVAWEGDTPSRITAQRTFLKRLRGLFTDTGDSFAMVAHTGGALDIHTLSFFDCYMDGEQLARYPSSFQPSAASFAVGYSGQPWGLRGAFWGKQWIGSGGMNRALVYALLHDTELWETPLLQETLAVAGMGTNAVFHPYWESSSKSVIKSHTGASRVSWYADGPRALVTVGNTGPEEDTVKLNVRSLTRIRNGEGVDLLTGKKVALKNECCTLVMPRGHGVSLLVGGNPISAPLQVSSVQPSLPKDSALWTANTEAAGVSTNSATLDGQPAIQLASTRYQARAEAVYRDPLPNTFTAVLLFQELPQRLIVRIGPVVLMRDGCWTTEGPLDGWSTGEGPTTPDKGPSLQPDIPQGVPFALALSMREGKLDALANGQPLVHGIQFRLPHEGSNRLSVETWAGFSALFRMTEISAQATVLYAPPPVTHPVMP